MSKLYISRTNRAELVRPTFDGEHCHFVGADGAKTLTRTQFDEAFEEHVPPPPPAGPGPAVPTVRLPPPAPIVDPSGPPVPSFPIPDIDLEALAKEIIFEIRVGLGRVVEELRTFRIPTPDDAPSSPAPAPAAADAPTDAPPPPESL